jgi:hypothetical protein
MRSLRSRFFFSLFIIALFAWLISHQPTVFFSQNKPATNNQPAVLFSQNKPAPSATSQTNMLYFVPSFGSSVGRGSLGVWIALEASSYRPDLGLSGR